MEDLLIISWINLLVSSNSTRMESVFQTACEILGLGMVTIFAILALVVLAGHLLIRIVNRSIQSDNNTSDDIPETHIVAIHAAVDVLTAGKGRIRSISSPSYPDKLHPHA